MPRKQPPETRHLEKRGNVWYIQKRVNGKRIRFSTGETDLRQACRVRDRFLLPFQLQSEHTRLLAFKACLEENEKQASATEPPPAAVTLSQAWQLFEQNYRVCRNRRQSAITASPAQIKLYGIWYRAFSKWALKNANAPSIHEITQETAKKYTLEILETHSTVTVNRIRNGLALIWCVLLQIPQTKTTHNPWNSLPPLAAQTISRRELTIEEIHTLFTVAQGELRHLLAIGAYTGLRLGDAACLDWTHIDLAKNILSLIPHKTARKKNPRITIPLHPHLREILHQTPPPQRTGPLLPQLAAQYLHDSRKLSLRIIQLFRQCGITTSAAIPGERRRRPVAGFHSLRHTFVSLCANNGVPLSIVQRMVGHSTPAMTDHYTHISIEAAREAINSLPAIGQQPAHPTPPPVKNTRPPSAGNTLILDLVDFLTTRLTARQRTALCDRLKPPPLP